MATFPISNPEQQNPRTLPDYLPVRMVNEFAYCPRLFFYEWVDGVFRESADTIEGSHQHKRVDKEGKGLRAAQEIGKDEILHSRSLTLSSDRLRVIAKLDLVEVADGLVTPVDYKHGKPREEHGVLQLWPPERVQLVLQGLILRENGYQSNEGVVYYATTRQRVRVEFTPEVLEEAETYVQRAWRLAAHDPIPPPLEDSPKCGGCSLAPICLPDEVNSLRARLIDPEPEPEQLALFDSGVAPAPRKSAGIEVRRLVTPRTDLRPVYLNKPGLRIGKSGEVLQVKERTGTRDTVVQDVRLPEICQLNLMGNVQITTQAIHALCEAEIPVCYFSMGGWFYGITTGLITKNVFLRERQFALASQEWFGRRLARSLVSGKVRNQRTLLLRNHVEPDSRMLQQMKEMTVRADSARSVPELLGVEGNAARLYFGAFQGLIKTPAPELDEPTAIPQFVFDFNGRNRRPPRDPINALLSLGYSLLAKDLTIACYAVGFDPMMGFYHQPRFGRPALALDLMEPFRPLIVDSAVLTAINTGMVTPSDFIRVGESVALTPSGRKGFFRAYELRMDTLVSHPLFGYRVSYRRLLEIQTRLLAKMLVGELDEYPVFVTR